MTAATYNMTCEQGTTFSKKLTITDNATPPVARNLSTYSGRMQVRPDIESSTALLDLLSTGGSPEITLNASGVIQITVSAAVTAALSQGGVYDLEIEDSSGVVERVIQGNFELSKEVTRQEESCQTQDAQIAIVKYAPALVITVTVADIWMADVVNSVTVQI